MCAASQSSSKYGTREERKRQVEFKPFNETLEPENLVTNWSERPAEKKCKNLNAFRIKQEATCCCGLHGGLSHTDPVWLGVHRQAGWRDCRGPQCNQLNDCPWQSALKCDSAFFYRFPPFFMSSTQNGDVSLKKVPNITLTLFLFVCLFCFFVWLFYQCTVFVMQSRPVARDFDAVL